MCLGVQCTAPVSLTPHWDLENELPLGDVGEAGGLADYQPFIFDYFAWKCLPWP